MTTSLPCFGLAMVSVTLQRLKRTCFLVGAGSYSYVAVGASGKTYEALAKPVRRRLLFAGEHTSMEVRRRPSQMA